MKTRITLKKENRETTVLDFSVQQLAELEQKSHRIIRFDCAHGYLDIHRFYRNPNDRTEFPEQTPSEKLFEECKKDVLQNWSRYFELYRQKYLND